MAVARATMNYRYEDVEALFQAMKPFVAEPGKLAADVVIKLAQAAFILREQVQAIHEPMQALEAYHQAQAQGRAQQRR
ncbi:MAG TPA: hypothetical protein GXX55_01490 [Firmicutes bacterium]|nr:hypothetical protein [Bacillota bacterium]